MAKFQIDFEKLGSEIIPDPNRIPLVGNENRIVRVAFDLFRFKEGNTEDLWQVQSADDGQEYLVRTYALPEDEENKVATSSDKWAVELDKKEENLTVAYRNIPILKLCAKDYGVGTSDIRLFQRSVFEKLATDVEFTNKLIRSLSFEKQSILKEAGFSVVKDNIDPRLVALEQKLSKK